MFCALFGFVGTIGGLWVMADQLQGDPGPPGPVGEIGDQGPPGDVERSPVIAELKAFDASTFDVIREFADRMEVVENQDYTVTSFGCLTFGGTRVVTAVRVSPFGNLDVDTAYLCARPQ